MKVRQEHIELPVNGIHLQAVLSVPEKPEGIVVFSHGSGSSHKSVRNNYVAGQLHSIHLATFLFDLLTVQEDEVYANRFNIPLLSERLLSASCWIAERQDLKDLPIAYFGASTGAASALVASVKWEKEGCRGKAMHPLKGIVCRGGRPDLASDWLSFVKVPVLFIVGESDEDVIELNHQAMKRIVGKNALQIIPGASHLFEEEGTLNEMTKVARDWLAMQFSLKLKRP
jgi:pimeloyl-ACP methyl ester carboxylesterase